jgi:hypothetical protein
MELTLSDQEAALLRDLLDRDLRDLKQEIGSTEGFEFKQELKAQEQTLVDLLDKLGGPAPENP